MFRIDEATCTGCGACVEACPAGAIALVDGRANIDQEACAGCGNCVAACPQGAITLALSTTAPDRAANLVRRPQVEVLPAEPRSSPFWAAVAPLAGSLGSALAWAARELLPAVLQAWEETSRRADNRPGFRVEAAGPIGRPATRRQERWRHGRRGRAQARSDRARR